MPLGTLPNQDLLKIEASTTLGGTYVVVSHIDNYTLPKNRPVSRRRYFQLANAISTPGAREVSLTLSGSNSVGDSGQDILKDAEESQATIFVRLLPDGVNGETGAYRVANVEYSGDPDDAGAISFQLELVGAITVVGTGL